MSARRAAAALVVLTLLSGCTDGADEPRASAAAQSHVDVDTAELRAAKADAGIEPCVPGEGPAPADGGLPDVTLACLGGGPDVALPDLRGPLVVNLFAQWCEPCRTELPHYQRLHEEAGDRIDVLGIDYLDTQPGAAVALAEDSGVTYPLLADPDGLLRQELRVRGLPLVLLVDPGGRVVHQQFVEIASYGQLTDLVREHLGVTV